MGKDYKHILIVDDIRINLFLLKELLSEEYLVTTTISPLKALEYLKQNHFDLIISDYMMPEMNGIELLKKIKERKPQLPVILISANNEMKNVRTAYKYGTEAYLFKPLDQRKLLNKVKSAISSKKSII